VLHLRLSNVVSECIIFGTFNKRVQSRRGQINPGRVRSRIEILDPVHSMSPVFSARVIGTARVVCGAGSM